MPFPSKPVNLSPFQSRLKRYPALFGIPFLLIVVGASFGLQTFTQTRYDLQDHKVKQMSNEQALGLDRKKKKFDIREEYYKLSAAGEQDWEPKRIARPNDFPELGVPPTEPPAKS
ncbi:cytochrome c oxidase assembly protein COX16-domain-containing protein [Suillus bovinus]|uniref:cytochrome c oxidase assembly protein COX16-domain-containing protein n=1 Tax=Suillus bovinus TaxID=48563 RepID=UPI001B8841AA|nr:cytochrome c oxidase assembly protein COX16-domain-containing protein [Suillus bovinus]KAG2135213.1 cytochrome c oxidase assembly protein COX16-domain-containing protein [Suillus bovinus]